MMKCLILFLIFWYSNCLADQDTVWWRHTIIYEILPYSFKDSDGNGVGDIKGITSKLDHFVDLGIETLHLTPIYESTFRDMGYDITNYYKITPKYGTMDDFDELVREMNKRNMKLLLDLVVNHSGHKHEWFEKSVQKIYPYSDFYVWKNSKGFDKKTQMEIPPNNWFSIFGGSAWTWNDKRKQFYFHHFLEEQPDFNLNNKQLKEELKKIIKFWLDKGVAGFRLDSAPCFFEDKYLRDDDLILRLYNQEETYEFIHELRSFLDEYNKKHEGIERIFVAEAHATWDNVVRYYGKEDYPVTHFPYTFNFEHIKKEIDARELNSFIKPWIDMLPKNAISVWMTEDHDNFRVGSRIRPEYSNILTIISMMLPGTVGCYYGQEIAMLNGYVRDDQIKDFSGKGLRDPARLIMQWDNTLSAGFSSKSKTYLPVNTDYFMRNVDYEKKQKFSHYQMFKDLSNLRKTDTFKYGNLKIHIPSRWVYLFSRSFKNQVYIIITNLSTILTRVDLNKVISELPRNVFVVTGSMNAGYEKGITLGDKLTTGFIMTPLSSIVLKGHFTKEDMKDFSPKNLG